MNGALPGLSARLADAEKRIERYELILRASRDAIWVFEARSGEVWWNDNAYRLFGYDRSVENLHEAWVARIHPDDRACVLAAIDEASAGSASILDDEYRLLFPDGRVAIVEDHAYIERDAAGAVVAYVGVVTDITSRREAERALRESEQRFREITENIDDVFWLLDVEGTRVLYVARSGSRCSDAPGRACTSELKSSSIRSMKRTDLAFARV